MESWTNISMYMWNKEAIWSYFDVYTSELVMDKATYHDNRVFLLAQK